jgi:hypothetical protein
MAWLVYLASSISLYAQLEKKVQMLNLTSRCSELPGQEYVNVLNNDIFTPLHKYTNSAANSVF